MEPSHGNSGTSKPIRDVVSDRKASPAPLRIRYDRMAIFLVGVVALLTSLVSALLMLVGGGNALLSAMAFLVAGGAVAVLRTLAMRDRSRKVDAAFRSAMGPSGSHSANLRQEAATSPEDAPPTEGDTTDVHQGSDAELFNAEAPEPAVPFTAAELREAAMVVAEGAAVETPQPSANPDVAAGLQFQGREWEPVEVPKPVYVAAAKAPRAAPQPLDLPEAPKAAGKPLLKQPAGAEQADSVAQRATALGNLDDVLQRRRA